MFRTIGRTLGTAAAVASISVLGSGLAFADATAYVAGGGGRAVYDHSSNQLRAFDSSCNGYVVAGRWAWDYPGGPGPFDEIFDVICQDGVAASKQLYPPSTATSILIQACHYADGFLFDCGPVKRSQK